MSQNTKIALIALAAALAVTWANNNGYLDFLTPKVESGAAPAAGA